MDFSHLLGDLNPEQFLSEYWQKKPLLIRNAIPDFSSPISPDELAGLACEETVESRILLETSGQPPWQLRHGPFQEDDFAQLPETHWTLLVQDVEKHLPELEALVFAFHFIPHWRIDDLMISYAPEHGTVGAHADDYDVFLLQGMGQRRWQISQQPLRREELIPELELEILSRFEPEQEWVLNPGDMLYLPPGVIHHGVALNDCMTYSIGFRAPRQYELAHSYLEYALEHTDTRLRYRDPALTPCTEPFLLPQESIERLKALLLSALPQSETAFNQWLGQFLTEPKSHLASASAEPIHDTDSFIAAWQQQGTLLRNSACRCLYARNSDHTITLFVNGHSYRIPAAMNEMVDMLCSEQALLFSSLQKQIVDPDSRQLLCDLYNAGHFYFDES